jgi:hypothetical protein
MAEGTAAHTVAEVGLFSALGRPVPDKYKVFKDTIDVDGHKIKVDDSMMDGAASYVSYVKELADKHVGAEIMIERKVKIYTIYGELFGKLDSAFYAPYQAAEVIDYKYGKGTKVDASDNLQLKFYALGLLLSLPRDEQDELHKIGMSIVQPRVYGGGIHRTETTTEALFEFHNDLADKYGESLNPDAPRTAGDQCKWCPAKTICPEFNAFAEDQLKTTFAAVALPQTAQFDSKSPTVFPESSLNVVKAMPIETIVGLLQHKKLIEGYLDAMSAYAKERAQTDLPFRSELEKKGWVLAQGRMGNREWTDEAEVIKRVAPRMPREVFTKTTVLTPTQLTEALKKQQIDIKLDDLITQKPPGIALVQDGPKVKRLGDLQNEFKGVKIDES